MMRVPLLIGQILAVMALAPSLNWLIKKMKALSQNRVGPSLFQVYADLGKLCRKEMVVSDTASWIFHGMPWILFAGVLTALFFVPLFWADSLCPRVGDAVVFVYCLALGRFFMALAALDTATSFGGMGSSREMMISSLAEPALLLSLFSLALPAQTLSISGMLNHFSQIPPLQNLFFTSLAFGALLIVTIAESARIPFDNPATHLELTMVHEAMILEYSGRYLALIEWAHQIKQWLFLSLLANLFFPWGIPRVSNVAFQSACFAIVFYLGKIYFLAAVVGWIEIHTAKLRLFRVPDLLTIAFVLALLSFLGQLMIGR